MNISTVGLAVIGDEVLLGEVNDLNIGLISREVFRLGADLSYACVLPDTLGFMIEHLTWMKERFDWVVTTGGIGTTHDDLTKKAICRIVGRSLVEAHEARHALEERLGVPLPARARELVMVPEGAELITNDLTVAPGFCIENLVVLPGIPRLVESMVGVLESKLSGEVFHSETIKTLFRESEVAHILDEIQAKYPSVKIGSYPEMENVGHKVRIVLRSRNAEVLTHAHSELLKRIEQ